MRAQNELLDAIQILIDKSIADRSTRITGGAVKSASGGLATVTINGYDYSIPYSGTAPTVGSTVRVFIPNGNMSDAFIGGGGGGGSTGTTNKIPSATSDLTNDSGHITNAALAPYAKTVDVPTKMSQLNNDSGFVDAAGGGGVQIVLSSTQPSGLKAGDYWYQIVT